MPRILKRTAVAVVILVAVALLTFTVAGSRYTPNIGIPAGFAGQHIEVNGVPLRVFQQGTGRDVLLIHGSPGSLEDFSSVAPTLARSFRVTQFDRPGYGFSGDTGQYSVPYNAETAIALIHRLGLQHVVVVGHSYGGATALAMALRDDPRIDAYVVLDSAAYAPIREADPAARIVAIPVLGTGFAMMLGQRLAPARFRQGIAAIFHTPPDEQFVALRTRLWSPPKVLHAVSAETVGYAADLAEQSPQYSRITKPVYVLAEADVEARRKSAERLHGDVRGSMLELLPNTGHYVQFEKAAEVIDFVRRAATEHPPQEETPTPGAANHP